MPKSLILAVLALLTILALACNGDQPTVSTTDNAGPTSTSPAPDITDSRPVPEATPVLEATPVPSILPPLTGTSAEIDTSTAPTPVPTLAPVAKLELTPVSVSLAEGDTRQVEVSVADGSGSPLSGRQVAWSSSLPGIVQVSATGNLTGVSAGTATVTATAEGVSTSATIQVQHGAVTSVEMALGDGSRLVATLRDDAGHQLTDRAVTWVSDTPGVVDVGSSTGVLTVGAAGVAAVTATSEGVSVTATVTVNPEPVAAVTISPNTVSLEIGDSSQLSAAPKDGAGNLVTGRRISWSTSNEGIAAVSPTGLVSGTSEGTATISATVEGVSATTTVTVNAPPADYTLLFSKFPNRSSSQPLHGASSFEDMHIFTSPDDRVSSVTFFVNSPNGSRSTIKTESAAPFDMLGTRADGAAQTLDPSQLTPNSYAITAEITQTNGNTVAVSATFTVIRVPVTSVEIAPNSVTVEEGQTAQLSAIVSDANGDLLNDRAVNWTSGDQSVAQVNSAGLLTGVAQGETSISAQVDGVTASIPVSVTRQQVTFTLQVAPNFDNPSVVEPLNGASLFGDIIIFVEPQESISLVTYQIDNSSQTSYTSDGGVISELGAAWSINASGYEGSQTLGSHSITAEITDVNGATVILGAVYESILPPIASVEIVVQPQNSDIIDPDINDLLGFPALDSPEVESLPVGFEFNLYAIVTDVAGNYVSDRAITWSSSNDLIASLLSEDAENGLTGPTFYGRYFNEDGSDSSTGNGERSDNIDTAVDSSPAQNERIKANSAGPVTITVTAGGLSQDVDLRVSFSWSTMTSGANHTCGLTGDLEAYCWGWGSQGQLGNGSTVNQPLPVPVSGGLKFDSISSDATHTCGIATGGDAYCWGEGTDGRLGNGSLDQQLTPALVSGGLQFQSVSAGLSHTCGVTTSRNVYCWGLGSNGQLGNGATGVDYQESEPVPVDVQQLGTVTFQEVSVGVKHTCALASDGQVYCWGSDAASGTIDDAPGQGENAPVLVTGGHRFESISAGGRHTCGVTTDGEAYCWGTGDRGKLGTGLEGSGYFEAEPAPVNTNQFGPVAFRSISAGVLHTCAVTRQSLAYCWGHGFNGKLGDGFSVDRIVPTLVSGEINFRSIHSGANQTCAITFFSEGYCWGGASRGQLGNGSTDSPSLPTPTPVSPPFSLESVSSGGLHTCGLTIQGEAFCWGNNIFGQVGSGNNQSKSIAVAVSGGHIFTSLSAGSRHTCAVDLQNDAYCWGDGRLGQLGNGSEGTGYQESAPVLVSGGLKLKLVSAGEEHTCGITVRNETLCWGSGVEGKLGNGLAENSPTPVPIAGGHTFYTLSSGTSTCGMTELGDVYCWGTGFFGQLGHDFVDFELTPVLVSGNHPFISVEAGISRNCGVTAQGDLYCWGRGFSGQLGNGSFGQFGNAREPRRAFTPELFASVSTGDDHTCGITLQGETYCWGSAASGQLGTGLTPIEELMPVLVAGQQNIVSVSNGFRHSCGVTALGSVYCWGVGSDGQLGNSSLENRITPGLISAP